MRGKILLKALEILEEGIMNQLDFFDAMLSSGYGASMGKIEYEYKKNRRISDTGKLKEENLNRRKRRLQLFLSQMKHDGLIKTSDQNLKISDKGKQKIIGLKNRLPDRHYEVENSDRIVIISFDIPEKLRRKRNWLREVIKNLGFTMIHQSVWVGRVRVPKEFILDLERMRILEFVEIFEVTKTGSLKKLQ